MAPKMDNLEDAVQKLVKDLHSRGTPAESHTATKISPDIIAYLHQTRNSFNCEIDFPFLQKVFQLLNVAFHCDQQKVQMLGLGVMQKLVEEERFNPKNFTGESRQAFPEMFVNTLAELCLEGSDEIAVEILRVSLKLACQPLWMQDPYALMKIIMFCMQVCGLRQSQNVKTAASATNVQAITSFCKAVLTQSNISINSVLPSDFQTVLTFFGDNLENLRNFSADPKGIEVLRTTLLSIFTIMQNTPKIVQHHPQFQEYVWQKVTPALCHWLGTPAEMYMQSVTRHIQSATGMITIADMEIVEIKLIAQIFLHLTRTYSRIDSMRCVLGSLLQRMLSVASVRQRLYTLNNLLEVNQELLDSPQLISELEGPNSQGTMPDTCIIELVSETLGKLAKIKHHEVESICTKLALAFLTSLEHVAEGVDLTPDQIVCLNSSFLRLKDTSPLTLEQLEEQLENLPSRHSTESIKTTEKSDAGDLTVTPPGRSQLDSVDSECEEGELEECLEDQSKFSDNTEHKLKFQSSFDTICAPRTEEDEIESARRFIGSLIRTLPALLSKISTVEADSALQQFASSFCAEEKINFGGIPFLNADAIYVTAYQTIRFVLRAREKRYYTRRLSRHDLIPMSQKEFVTGVLGCGLLIHMSSAFILEVFRTVMERDVLAEADFPVTAVDTPFVQVIRDIEGIGRDHPYLHDCVRLENCVRKLLQPEKEAGSRLARYLVGRCWNGIEQSLQSVFLDMFSRKKLLSPKKEYTEEMLHLMCASLGGLQRYADLCARLYLYELCSGAYALLARICCSSLYPQPSLQSQKTTVLRLHPWNVLSIDVILRRSLEMGSRNADCWKAFFTCYLYLHRMETRYLINAKSASLTKRELQDCSSTVAEITIRYMGKAETKPTDPLDTDHSYMALGALLNALDGCFLDAVNKLNLTNLCNFVRTMGEVSLRIGSEQIMLMERLTNIVILSAKCGRPLLHVMIIWASAIPFLYQAAASKAPIVSEKAVSYIHSIVAALTSTLTEGPHFHFNELQLKPFESLICSQVCSIELQELIVYSLCNLVETSKADIKSGWKSLFCTLRGIQLDCKSGNLIQAVGDVYEAYLNSDSVLIFCGSLWECLQSLMKLYRTALDGSVSGSLPPSGQLALKYIRHSVRLLFSLHFMNDFPGLVETNRLRSMCNITNILDPIPTAAPTIEALDEHLLEQIYTWVPGEEIRSTLRDLFFGAEQKLESGKEEMRSRILELDNEKGVLIALFIVLDGLTTGLLSSWNALNNDAVDTVIFIFQTGANNQCAGFSLYAMSSFLLPVIQQLLRRKNGRHDGPFQQLIGLFSDLLADICVQNQKDFLDEKTQIETFLTASFSVFADCISSGHETTVKLATSCVRHLVVRICSSSTGMFRTVVCRNLLNLLHVTFAPLYELMTCYNHHSKSIYGDSGHIKIAITNDSTLNEMQRVRQNAFQVFLTDTQQSNGNIVEIDPESKLPGNSFTFLVYPSELDYHTSANNFVKRITLEQLTQNLMALTQIIDIIRLILAAHADKKSAAFMSSYDRLLLLCSIRQVHTLASDFNHLSGLKFLIKRVLASPRAVSLYRIAEICGVLHSLELLRIASLNDPVFRPFLSSENRPCEIIKLDSDMFHRSSADFVAEYFKIWVEFILTEYVVFVHPDSSGTFESKRRVSMKMDDLPQEGGNENRMIEVQLKEESRSSTSLDIFDNLRCHITKNMLFDLMQKCQETMTKDDNEHQSQSQPLQNFRKNPFREAVAPTSELPQDVAAELKAAMDEDYQLCKTALLRPIVVHCELDGFTPLEKLTVAPLVSYLCWCILDRDLLKNSDLWIMAKDYLTWLQKTLYGADRKQK